MTTRTEAVDLMMGHLMVWCQANPEVVSLWPDTPQSIPENRSWVRPTVRHATGGQASLSGEDGTRRWKRAGTFIIQVFTLVGGGASESDALAGSLERYFEGIRSSPVWYRNIRAIEVGKDGSYVQVNFMAEFEYDDFH